MFDGRLAATADWQTTRIITHSRQRAREMRRRDVYGDGGDGSDE